MPEGGMKDGAPRGSRYSAITPESYRQVPSSVTSTGILLSGLYRGTVVPAFHALSSTNSKASCFSASSTRILRA